MDKTNTSVNTGHVYVEPAPRPFESSDSLDKIFAATSKMQASMESAKKDKKNPFFKSNYADLESCWEAVKKPLTDNGLSVLQLPMSGTQTLKVKTILTHSSGQWIANTVELRPTKTDPQGTGSAMTYARRYGLMAICGISPEEDDGNAASGKQPARPAAKPQREIVNHAPQKAEVITKAQVTRLHTIVSSSEWTGDQVKEIINKKYKLTTSKDLNKVQYEELVNYIQNNNP